MPEETPSVPVSQDPTPVVDTPETISEQSPSTQTGHDDANQGAATSTQQTTPDVDQDDSPIDKEEYVRLKREAGKLRQTQEQFEQVKKSKESYEKWLLAKPERVKQALVELDGLTEEQATEKIEAIRKQRPDLWQEGGTQAAPQIDINTVVSKVREQESFDRDLQEFIRQVPEMAPDKDPEKNKEKIELANDVNDIAFKYMRRDPNLGRVEAWKKAYKALTGKTDEDIESARAEGRKEGLYLAATDRTSNIVESLGDKPAGGQSVKLTESEREAARMLGISDEEYAKYKT